MTREEAKKEVESALKFIYTREHADEVLEMLFAEPCEDAISRTAVIKAIKNWWSTAMMAEGKPTLCEDIKHLPPVKVEPQEWIDKADKVDAKFGRHDYVCPKCNEYARRFVGGSEDWWCVGKPNYCPNCGAKMKGDTE